MSSRESDDGCMGSTCRCLASVPCGSLCVFIAFVSALVACAASLIVAMMRTRVVLSQPELWSWFMYACIGVAVGLIVVACLFLIVLTSSARLDDGRPFVSARKLRCARAANCVVIVTSVLLQFVWIVITVIISVSVLYLLLIDRMIDSGASCVNLAHYALPRSPQQFMCEEKLETFQQDIKKYDLLICYSASLISSVIIVISSGLFMMLATADFARLGKQQNKSPSSRCPGRDHVMNAYYDGQSTPHETAM